MTDALKDHEGTASIGGRAIPNLRFADDIDGLAGRQRKRLEDNIREWTGLEFAESQKAVENRGKWRKLVANSTVVSQRPSRLRN